MIAIRTIDVEHQADIRLANEPFQLVGRIVPSYRDEQWDYAVQGLPEDEVSEMCFPDEAYELDEASNVTYLGAYDGEDCIGLAVLEPGFFKYLYLADLKVKTAYRGRGVGQLLIDAAKDVAREKGLAGLTTIAQDNNLAACLFYLKVGFEIGGFDNRVYKHTPQEGKADVIFYCEVKE